MRTSGGKRKALGRTAIIAASSLAIAALIAIGFLFLSSFGISQVASNARNLHWTNAAAGSAGILRASVGQAVFFSFDERLGVSSVEARDAAIDEARANLESMSEHLASNDRPQNESLVAQGELLVQSAAESLDLAADGRPDEAELVRLDEFEPAFNSLSASLEERQSALAQEIADSEQTNGRIARVTELAITLILPGTAMIVFWWVLRRRVHRRETEMQARIEAEQQVSQAKDDIIAGLSHELRTPLTGIVGFSNLLLEGDVDRADADEMLAFINAGSTDLSRMVEDLLVAARLDADALTYSAQRVDLAAQVHQVIAPYVRAGDSIRVRVPEIDVYADPLLVRQIVHNLVSNARKHGGQQVVVTGNTDGGQALLVVADNGEGLPQHVEENLFERFVNKGQEALISGSVGLGLAISKELVQKLGGSIRYKRVDGWTTFTVRLKTVPTTASSSAQNVDLPALTQA